MCSIHTYTCNRSKGDKINDIDDDGDDVVIQSKNDTVEDSKEEVKDDDDNEIDGDGVEEVNDDHDDDFDDDNNTDEDDNDDNGNYVSNANKELDFSDDEEFLAELSNCSDDVIEVKSKGKGVKKAKGGNQHYREWAKKNLIPVG